MAAYINPRRSGRLSCFTDVPYPHFNIVLQAQLSPENVDSTIQSILDQCKSRKVPMGWIIGPATSPSTLVNSLVAQGFMYIAGNAGMAVDLQRLNDRLKTPHEFVVKRINTEEDINT
jgi:hypothetical protein